MYYYAYYDTTTYIVQGVYALPTPLTVDGYVAITQEQYESGDLVGKIYNPDTNTFESPREWVCNTDQVQYTDTGNTNLTEKLNAIDTSIANIQLQAGEDGASAYEIAVANGFEGTETQWLASLVGATGAQGEKGDKGDTGAQGEKGEKGDTGAQGIQGERGLQGEQGIQGVKGDKGDKGDTGADGQNGQNGADGQDGKSAYQIALDNGFEGTQAQWLDSLKGEKGDKGDAGESGTSASITADEVLTKIKTVDGENSGLDSDMLDGKHANEFATSSHTHSNYATQADITAIETALDDKSDIEHTHPNYATVASLNALETEVDGKADVNHTHTQYAAVDHTHTQYAAADHIHTQYAAVDHTHTGFVTETTYTAGIQGKADAEHTHAQSDITGLSTALGGKANASHNHETSDITGLDTALSEKANATHTHSINDISETTAKKIMTEAERTKLSGIETGANKTTVDNALSATSTNPVQNKVVNTALSGKANSSHTHSIGDITNLQSQLDGKSGTSHSHNAATQTANGFLSKEDKTKLDGIATGANKTTVDSALSATSTNPVQNKVINTALAEKANESHTHSISDVSNLQTTLNEKASASHTHTLDDVSETTNKKVMTAAERTKLSGVETGANKYTHPSTHAASMITGLAAVATSGKYSDLKNVPTSFTPSTHTHTQSEITGLATALNGKANANHTHDYCTLSQVYPVGSIYLSVNNTNPSTLFGGTWVAFGTGRVLMGVPSGGSAGTTGGSETATIAAHKHTTQGHTLTIGEIPSHNHALLNYNADGNTSYTFTKNSVEAEIKKGYDGNVTTTYKGGDGSHSHGDTGTAGAATINIVQPYITCYMWKRTV